MNYGYKVHIARDSSSGVVRRVDVTCASVHDSRLAEDIIHPSVKRVLCDRGYPPEV
ncbi:MAG: hypothetical protein B6D57_04630 [Candidatus Coatesbacteria bacterium 4484_99]|uniref:Transposase IS4-like domain-containing protein n=1 Tax=Candidatus Coatesbacteria bacterium 4484_99 TaxID=1970774 RepID=A0A1W9RZX6_9BACT|nr:MAG: hypothetical protein B6D57_04630 [Candidatus Coatesbacteria bacterium 4484_99]RLC40021.1 MAG: hypothetical protein DRH49_07570 [Candidatus Coatesbacteria bacterium]RLC41974.1 MAG: hypothetical protein DRH51_01930 [Candidatus Coatesbacteria bacterium]RLC44695.1 MAG: hypothetical protein DRH44_01420 [Candidatus Coatesbacteria bacterium]HEC80322.1 IS4/IS5 family transposase [Bacillota bacterium]